MDKCKTCGGSINRIGNYYICEYCSNKWEIDSGNDVHAVDRANAWSALRDGDFEKAIELFENIITKDPENHEAYWGRALSFGGIVYVTDMNENKKVPTCNNITEESFINNKNVQKAISLAPNDIADEYKRQAEYIENVRKEWLLKASKEPAYDVFISFKDSDRENGIERTQDSIDAQDLYNALIAEGYKVFFSRISLRDKVSEQYEPYIYNAIKTAKVMIVFGEKAEYFSSVWIKNEWSRFKSRIEKGEKHKNSLVTVYKNMSPADLPIVLKSRQCLNASDMTFLSDLTRHIKRVIEDSNKSIHLDKIEITGGKIAKKASNISVNAIQTREIGSGAIAETSISEQQSLAVITSMLNAKQWDSVISLCDNLLFDNPTSAEAIFYRFLATHKVSDIDDANFDKNKLVDNDFLIIEKILNCASASFANTIINSLFRIDEQTSDKVCYNILKVVLHFKHSQRVSNIKNAFDNVIKQSKYESFLLLLNTLGEKDVDKYIEYNLAYANLSNNNAHISECINRVLSVDEGNISTLKLKVLYEIKNHTENVISNAEQLFAFSQNIEDDVLWVARAIVQNLTTPNHCNLLEKVAKYYPDNLKNLVECFCDAAESALTKNWRKETERLCNLAISIDENNAKPYWILCLLKAEIPFTKEKAPVFTSLDAKTTIMNMPEFHKCLSLCNQADKDSYMEKAKTQMSFLERSEKNLLKSVNTKFGRTKQIIIDIIVTIIFGGVSLLFYKKYAALGMLDGGYYFLLISIFCLLMFLFGIFGRLRWYLVHGLKFKSAKKIDAEKLATIQKILGRTKKS